MKVQPISNIQALRALAALLVVGRHAQVYMERAMGGPTVLGRFLVGDMGVDIFFVISGFIMVATHRTAFTRVGQAFGFLYRRASRIYPLYWVCSLPALAVYLWRPDWLHRLGLGMPVHLVQSFLLWPQRSWPLLGQGWSLVYEIYFYVVFTGLLFLPGKWFARGLLGWAALVVAGSLLLGWRPALATPETGLVCASLTLEFIAGAAAGLILRDRAPHAAGWGMLAAGLGVAWIALVVLPLETHPTGFHRVLAYGLPGGALVYGAVALESAGWRLPRFLAVVGDWSYSIYLTHIFVVAALARLVPASVPHGRLTEVVLMVSWMAVVLLVGALSYRYLEQPLLRLTRRDVSGWPRKCMRWFVRPAVTLPSTDHLSP